MRRASTSPRESTAAWPSDPVHRGETSPQGQVLVTIDNPELLTRLKEAEAARAVATADLKRIEVGTRAEVVAARRAALASAEASARLAEQTYDRTKQLTARDFASVQKLDEATATLDVARRSQQQAKLALDEAIAGYTVEERGVAQASRRQGRRRDRHPEGRRWRSSRSRRRRPRRSIRPSADIGEFVSPGVPLLSLVDLSDIWLRFDLREDLVKGLKVGDRFEVRVPALGDRTDHRRSCARSPRAASMPDGAPRARPATSTSGPSRSAPIPSIPCPGCGRA